MNIKPWVVALCIPVLVAGCSTRGSSKVIGARQPTTWDGPVLILTEALPAGVDYQLVGSVEANARAGYSSAQSLYPLLAVQARKIGANAVMSVKGGHKVAGFSWAAPYVNGLAGKVEDVEKLKGIGGSLY